jgi:hypothetical protein
MERERFSFREGVVCFVFIISMGIPAVVFGTHEPNNVSGGFYAAGGNIPIPETCPNWITVLDRNSTDTHTTERLIIQFDGCKMFGQYEVFTMEQGALPGVLADLEPGDIFVEWDEDQGDGSRGDFTFSGTYVQEEPDYVAVSSTNDDIINWTVFRVETAGTLTITGTHYNEHDAIRVKQKIMLFEKYDDVPDGECTQPDEELTYTICWGNMDGQLLEDAYIIDWLPEGVSYPPGTWSYEPGDPNDPNEPPFYLIPPDPGYDPETHSYVWPLGDVDPNTWGCVSLTVVVNDKAVPGGILHNVAELWGTLRMPDPNDPNLLYPETFLIARATLDTDVCCYAGIAEILYVDQSATNGGNTGLNWKNAFLELQDALDYARSSICGTVHSIYVAQGTYSPGDKSSNSFVLPDGISVYGGFPKGGGELWQRNPGRYQAVLTGTVSGSP